MRRRALHHGHTNHLNVTPLIDVVMCLIIFYLIVGRLALTRQARIDLPATAAGQAIDSAAALIIDVASTTPGAPPAISLAGQPVTPAVLVDTLRTRHDADPKTQVHVRADRTLPYSAVAPVLDACRDAGLTSVRLVTERTR